jgi:hypothetical protein
MIAEFNKPVDVATSYAGRNFQAQCPDALCGTLVERVCRFLEQYPFSPTDGEDIVPSASIGAIALRQSGRARGERATDR